MAYLLQGGSFIVFTGILVSPWASLKQAIAPNGDMLAVRSGTIVSIALAIGLCAGLVNGCGQLAYQKAIASITPQTINFMQIFVLKTVVEAITLMVTGYLFFGERLSANRFVSVACAILTIYFARK
jgi:drug/metabolite transporter (DMT)-like permease